MSRLSNVYGASRTNSRAIGIVLAMYNKKLHCGVVVPCLFHLYKVSGTQPFHIDWCVNSRDTVVLPASPTQCDVCPCFGVRWEFHMLGPHTRQGAGRAWPSDGHLSWRSSTAGRQQSCIWISSPTPSLLYFQPEHNLMISGSRSRNTKPS